MSEAIQHVDQSYSTIEESLEHGYYGGFPEEVIARIKHIAMHLSPFLTSDEVVDSATVTLPDGHSYYYSVNDKISENRIGRYIFIEYLNACRSPVYFRVNMWYDRNTQRYITITTH